MTALVSEALMERTWQTVGASTPTHCLKLQQKCGEEQQELAGFVTGSTAKLRTDAAGVGLYAYVVIAEAFRKSGAKFRRIKPGGIMRAWDAARDFVENLKASGRSELGAAAASTSEPAVFNYILGALSDRQDDPVVLPDDEYWHLLCVLKTVVDCLHEGRKQDSVQ